MSIAIPKWLGPCLIGVGAVGVALALIVATRAYIQLRRAEYYVIRETARRTSVRAMLAAFILLLLTLLSLFIPRQDTTHTPTAVATMTPSTTTRSTPLSALPTASPTGTPTPTPLPTATEPFIPTSTPQATLPVTFTRALSGAVPPPADARIELWTLARGVDENNQPVGPATQFPVGIERVYLFFRYDGLLPDVPWTNVWYHNGQLLSGGTNLWEAQRPSGEWYLFLTLDNGYPVGEYQVQIWLGGRLQLQTFFSVIRAEG